MVDHRNEINMSDNPHHANQQQSDHLARPETVTPNVDSQIYQRLVKEVRDYAIFMLDPQGFIQSWNSGAERLTVYKPEEIIGKHFSFFYTEPDLQVKKPKNPSR